MSGRTHLSRKQLPSLRWSSVVVIVVRDYDNDDSNSLRASYSAEYGILPNHHYVPAKIALSPAQAVGYLCDATCSSTTGCDLVLADSVFCPEFMY